MTLSSGFSEAYYRSLIEDALDIVSVMDPAGTILYASPANKRILGYEPDELVGRNGFSLVHEEDRPQAMNVWKIGLEQAGVPQLILFRYRHKDGSWRHLESIGKYVTDTAGPPRVIINSRDVTDRLQLQTIVRRSEKMAAMGQLAAGIAHELNNPLSVILGFAQSMLPRLVPADPLHAAVQSIEREALRCRNLVRNLLTFSRDRKPGMAPEDPVAVIEAALSLVENQTRMKGVSIRREFAADSPPILADSNQIQQVIINLCTNAMDAMPQGGALTVAIQRQEKNVEIRVSDTGAGIPKEIQAKIFEPFFTTKEIGKGTGLGLSLVYEIVKSHLGHIDFETAPGKGTTFIIRLGLAENAFSPRSSPPS